MNRRGFFGAVLGLLGLATVKVAEKPIPIVGYIPTASLSYRGVEFTSFSERLRKKYFDLTEEIYSGESDTDPRPFPPVKPGWSRTRYLVQHHPNGKWTYEIVDVKLDGVAETTCR